MPENRCNHYERLGYHVEVANEVRRQRESRGGVTKSLLLSSWPAPTFGHDEVVQHYDCQLPLVVHSEQTEWLQHGGTTTFPLHYLEDRKKISPECTSKVVYFDNRDTSNSKVALQSVYEPPPNHPQSNTTTTCLSPHVLKNLLFYKISHAIDRFQMQVCIIDCVYKQSVRYLITILEIFSMKVFAVDQGRARTPTEASLEALWLDDPFVPPKLWCGQNNKKGELMTTQIIVLLIQIFWSARCLDIKTSWSSDKRRAYI